MPAEQGERKERPNLIILAFIGIVVLLAVQVQTVTKLSATEKRVGTAEGKLDRIESWIVADRQTQAQWHEDSMQALASINSSETKSVAILDFIVAYYKRAEQH